MGQEFTTGPSAYFHYVLNAQKQVANFAQQWTAYKNAARNGTDPSLGPEPVPPALGNAPTAVAPGFFKRIKGSHHIFGTPGEWEIITVPVRGGATIKAGLANRIAKDAGITW